MEIAHLRLGNTNTHANIFSVLERLLDITFWFSRPATSDRSATRGITLHIFTTRVSTHMRCNNVKINKYYILNSLSNKNSARIFVTTVSAVGSLVSYCLNDKLLLFHHILVQLITSSKGCVIYYVLFCSQVIKLCCRIRWLVRWKTLLLYWSRWRRMDTR